MTLWCAGDVALVPCAPTVAFKRPQVLLVSATMPPAALKVAEGWLSPGAAHMHVMHAGSDLISSTIIQVSPRLLAPCPIMHASDCVAASTSQTCCS